MTKQIIKPEIIAFEVTRKCYYNCKHCRASASAQKQEKPLTADQCKSILKSVAKYNNCTIILTGGEPMERDDIYELIEFGNRLKLKMVMATCGYLIDNDSISKLKESGLKALSFSLDGASAESHDTFRQTPGAFNFTVSAAIKAREIKIPFQINTTISKINANEVHAIAKLAAELGANCFNPFILVPTARAEQICDAVLDPVEYEAILNELLRIKLKSKIHVRVTCGPQFARVCQQAKQRNLTENAKGCLGGREFAFISFCGNVQVCGFLDISAGSLVENGFNFARIWEKSDFLNEIRNRDEYKENCSACEYLALCGGCRARAYAMTGDYLAADPLCKYKSVLR